MEALNDIQEELKANIVKAKSNFKKCPKERLTATHIETRIERLEQLWKLFHETHIKIISQIKKSDLQSSNYYKCGIYDEVEEFYIEFKSQLKEALNSSKPGSDSNDKVETGQKEVNHFKLPEVKIPVFSGKYTEWQTFKDLFVGLIHKNCKLDDAQKLYYLKGYLTGEAELLLRNCNVSSDNYTVCWKKLESMYDNKRFLANGALKRLFSQKSITTESAFEIKKLLNITCDCLQTIKNIGIDTSSWDVLIIYIVSAKLDKDTKKAWELQLSTEKGDDLPTFDSFRDFLTGRFRGLENLDEKTDRKPKHAQSFHVFKDKLNVFCVYCSDNNHKIQYCPKFVKESIGSRRNFVQDKGLCFRCLGSNHSVKSCKSNVRCQECKRRHHTLIHDVRGDNVISSAQEEASAVSPIVSCHSIDNRKKTVLLTTALVEAESKTGHYRMIRALLDQGSQGSFITESMVQYLGLKKTPSKRTIFGVGGNKNVTTTSIVSLNIKSRLNPKFQLKINAHVLTSITALLPAVKVARVEWVDLKENQLADPEYFRPSKIDILLGAEVFSQAIQEGVKKNISNTLLAQETMFGWVLSGVVEIDSCNTYSHITVMHTTVRDDELLRRFWEMEAEPSGIKRIMTDEEVECEKIFASSTTRNEDGRYIVRLPVRNNNIVSNVGDSEAIAEKRLKGLELRLRKNPKLKKDYKNVIEEYIDLKHMEKVTEDKVNNKKAVYLPHHAVVREEKDTTKVRVVFDASCKGSNGMSLNDNLLVGPTLQMELRHILIKWRRHKICLTSDIIKMYRQVLVNRDDTHLQRILWREKDTIEKYELLTVTFGTASAPYLAVRTLQQVARDECQEKEYIKDIIMKDFYIDDLMSGAENIEEAFQIYAEISKVLGRGGFQLQKWNSNSKELLNKIKSEKGTDKILKIKMDDVTKILGLTWNSNDDVFQYSLDLTPTAAPVTKRKIISNISRLFDPMGWLAPTIVLAKIYIQKLWLAGLEWDEPIPSTLLKEWNTYYTDLASLTRIRIPRWSHTSSNTVKLELHGFSDASKMAYSAVVYLRAVDTMGHITICLITSKTKVAPIKQVSIPRLELCGATLLAKLIREVGEVLEIPKVDWHAWTDSEVVLAWMNGHPSRWKTFVANRVSDILTTLDSHHWSHVPSKLNAADCASRGVPPSELECTTLWWQGPAFLRDQIIDYKRSKYLITNLEEIKSHTMTFDVSFWNKFSSLNKMVRVLAYCRRFANNIRKQRVNRYKIDKQYLSREELEGILEISIKRSQEEGFEDELKDLKNKKEIKSSSLKALNIFLDDKGIIRVGGRLELSKLDYERVHPILIAKNSFITNLLIDDAHKKTMHGGPQIMVTYLRSKYWIIGVKLLCKRFVRGCVKCIRYAARATTQLMGQLPMSRVTPSKPFLRSGVDYAGPISIRVSKGRGNKSYKGYIALFICMATRAVHLEAVSDMSTQGFLSAFKRFVARRGRCAELHSDNGTNFVGAARELSHLFDHEKGTCHPELAEELANCGTEWHFIPPRAPNFGGLWEAGIKSTKYHLKRVIGNSTLTFEEMITVLAQIESCLNSRPLSYIEDQDKLTILTPGHFLIGEPLVVVPDFNYEKSNITSLKRWQLSQRMMQEFWRRWSQDYLNQFLQRYKWSYRTPEPAVGDVVLVKEDDMAPGKWLMGKVEQKHPGPDGITRVVSIRTGNSIFKRPVSKLILLPLTV